MTREEAKELLPIIQAFAEGKTIQGRTKDRPWFDLLDNKLQMSEIFEYRIKQEPKYRPFKNQKECWEEMLKHFPFGWIKSKKSDYYTIVGSVYSVGEESKVLIEISPRLGLSGEHAYNQFEFADGAPFGIEE